MDPIQRETIRMKLPFLAEFTGNQIVLLTHLFSAKVLSMEENETIQSKPTSYEKNVTIYDIVITKGPEAFQKLIDCLKRSENEHVADLLLNPVKSSQSGDEQLWFDVLQTVPFFSGRDEELQKLNDCWQKHKQSQSQQFTIISGLGGIGKSELVRVYAKSFYETENGNCIWIYAQTEESLLSSFRRLAENSKVNVQLTDYKGKDKDFKNIISDIFKRFRNKKCLVIFDSVEQYTGSLQQILQPLRCKPPGETMPFILITTRFRKLRNEFGNSANCIELDVLKPEHSSEFLIMSLNLKNKEEKSIAQILGEKLQHFPLALQQAVPFIKHINEKSFRASDQMLSIQQYLAVIENQKKPLLDFPLSMYNNRDSFSQTFLTWKMTMGRIQDDPEIGSISRDIMHIISFFSADGIDVQFLLEILPEYFTLQLTSEQVVSTQEINSNDNRRHFSTNYSENILRKAVLLPSQYCMYSISEKKIYVHRLVQEVTRLELEEQGKLKPILITLLTLFTGTSSVNKLSINSIGHVVHLWDHAAQVTEIVEKFKSFPNMILKIMHTEGKHNEALLFANKFARHLKEY